MHEDVRHLQFSGGFNHFIAHVQTGHIVDNVRTGGNGGAGGLRVHGVNADGGAHLRDCLDDRQDAALLLLHADAHGTGAGGLTANVDNGGALGNHAGGAGDSVGGGVVLAAVAEGVGGDVEDAHHEGAFGGERVAGQGGYTGGVCGFSHGFIVPNLRCSHICRSDWGGGWGSCRVDSGDTACNTCITDTYLKVCWEGTHTVPGAFPVGGAHPHIHTLGSDSL